MYKFAYICLIAVFCVPVFGATPDIVFDACDISHHLLGFGAQIWSGDMRIDGMLGDLNLKYVRMKFGGSWTPPADTNQALMDAYVTSKYGSDTNIRKTYAMLNEHGISVIANFFEGPSAWLGTNNVLNSANYDDLVRLWASIAYYMHTNGMPIAYIEMFNEPEGDWNIKVPGTAYNTVVKLLRQELDSRGLTSVKICGPGLAYLYNAPNWFNALDTTGVAALGAWSTHAWDEGWGNTAATPSFLDQRYQTYFDPYVLAKDPSRSKPVIITEYATGILTYNGVTFTSDASYDSNQFAERSFENTLTLINNGANILSYWQAADHDWMTSGTSGFMRDQSSGSTLRPVYYAMSTFVPFVPDNAGVVRKTWSDSSISAAAFVGNGKLVAAFANTTAGTVSRVIQFAGISSMQLESALAFINGQVVDKLAQIGIDYTLRQMTVTLPRESTLTVTASIDSCYAVDKGDFTADCRVNFADYAAMAGNWLVDNRQPMSETSEDFEDFATSTALTASWVPTSATTMLTVSTSVVHGGQKAMQYSYNTGNSPYYAKAEHWLDGGQSGVDWSGYDRLGIWFKCTAAKEPLQVNVVNKYGTNVLMAKYGTPTAGDWTKWEIDLSSISQSQLAQIGRVDIFFTANWYGAGTTYFDDITVYKSSSLECQDVPIGDADKNCVVDFDDLRVVSENWLDCMLFDQVNCW